MEAEGWGKLREAVTGSEAEGLYGLLRGVTHSPTIFCPNLFPVDLTSALVLLLSLSPLKSPQNPKLWIL